MVIKIIPCHEKRTARSSLRKIGEKEEEKRNSRKIASNERARYFQFGLGGGGVPHLSCMLSQS
jgi:hypothetical protein